MDIDSKSLMAYKGIKHDVDSMLTNMGLDTLDPSIRDTAHRVAKMFVFETCSSLFTEPPKMKAFPNDKGYDQMLVQRNIMVRSLCEHHLVPFTGVAHVAYIPGAKLLGLSKFIRIVDYFARKPQLQERLTNEIASFLSSVLETEHVAVVLECEHLCYKIRGVKDEESSTVTSYLGGNFRKQEVRIELFTFINLGHVTK